MHDTEPYFQMVEPFWSQLAVFHKGVEAWRAAVASTPTHIVDLFTVHFTQYEISNGGFWQLFWNSTGTIAPEAVTGFDRIGMTDVAILLKATMKELAEPYPLVVEDRRKLLPSSEELYSLSAYPFDDRDNRFYELAGMDFEDSTAPERFVPFANRYAQRFRHDS